MIMNVRYLVVSGAILKKLSCTVIDDRLSCYLRVKEIKLKVLSTDLLVCFLFVTKTGSRCF